jgi:C_GCAxxG_C_C family probable redox protein
MKRRIFLSGACAAAISGALSSCGGAHKRKAAAPPSSNQVPGIREIARNMDPEELKTLIGLRAAQHMSETGNCAQATFMALQDVFEFGGTVDVKALTALPGIAERGETCGTIVAALMAIGMVYGGVDRTSYDTAVQQANHFIDRFRQEISHTHCREILKEGLGKDFDLRRPEDLTAYRSSDGPAFCSNVAAKAAEVAVEIILKR